MVRFSTQTKRLRLSDEQPMPVPSAPPVSGNNVTVTLDVDVLDCSVCMESMVPPIFQCSNGHVTCNACYCKLNNVCPTCTSPMGIRNLQLEKLMETMFAPCKYGEVGCRFSSKFFEKAAHESCCEFRPWTCPLKPCNASIPLRELPHHLAEDHHVQTDDVAWEYRSAIYITSATSLVLLKVDGLHFLLHQEKEALGNVVFLTSVSSPSSDEFSYEVEVKPANVKKRLTFEGVPHSITQGLERQAMDFFVIPANMYPGEEVLKLEISLRRTGSSTVKKKITFSDSLF